MIGVTDEALKVHFKEKHKTNTIKSFLLKRICRICAFDKAPNDSELAKHIESEHPKSEFWVSDSDDEELGEVEEEKVEEEKVELKQEVRMEHEPALKEDDNNSELERRFNRYDHKLLQVYKFKGFFCAVWKKREILSHRKKYFVKSTLLK